MAIETRTIVFDRTELMRAAFAYCVKRELAPERARLVDIEAFPEAEDRIALRFDRGGADPIETALSYNEMAAALIAFCATADIPLPRYARKRLTPAGEGMALIVRLPEFAGEAPVEPGHYARRIEAQGVA